MIYGNIVVALGAISLVAGNILPREEYEKLFFDWMRSYDVKVKDGAEFAYRLQNFANKHDEIMTHNADPANTYQLGHNQFSHMTLTEFHDYVHLGGVRPGSLRRNPTGPLHEAPKDVSALPASVNWVTAGAVTGVKDQGNCGSCWSFSATGGLEGAYQIKYKSLLSFAEQELVSCDTVDAGCNGGWMDDAFTYVQKNGGITTEDQYPYTSGTTGQSGTCKSSGYVNVASSAPKSFTDVQTGSVDALMSAVAQQPVSIAIQANQAAFQSYKSGVLTGRCGQRLDHGVLAAGYGQENGIDYWLVKNSWGTSWGEQGYIKIERSSADLCGVLDAPSYPNL